MEICEQSEAFVEEDGDLVFHHTKVILRQNDEFFYAVSDRRLLPSSVIDLNPSNLTKIPTKKIWPEFDYKFSRAPNPLPPNCYVKRPSLLHYGDTTASFEAGVHLLNEATVCEILKKNPHPNIARYLGCVIEAGRIKGLCFVKYHTTLLQRVRDSTPVDAYKCLQGIEEGVKHLHGLGLIHNDLNPSNIMMDGDKPVIIDFDSCKSEGTRLGTKAGTTGWEIGDSVYAQRANDMYAMAKIREFLTQGQSCE